jgi:predicted aldo/keto reductase-like oxidoreductase
VRYRLLGKSGVRISEVALGTMTFGEDWGWGASPEVRARMLDLFADAGGNVVDTADVYTNGTSETILGEVLKGGAATGLCSPPNSPTKPTLVIRTVPATTQEDSHLDRGEPASTADRPYRPVLGARP